MQEKHLSKIENDKASLARQLSGIWRRKKDLEKIDSTILRLRKGRRLKRLGIG